MNQEFRYRKTETAGTVLIKEIDGELKIALARDPEKGDDVWVLPKGHVRNGESLEETATRETREEVGVKNVQLIHYMGYVTRRSVEDWGETVEKKVHLFLAYAFGSSNIEPNNFETVVEAKWFNVEEAIPRIHRREDREFLHTQLIPMLNIK